MKYPEKGENRFFPKEGGVNGGIATWKKRGESKLTEKLAKRIAYAGDKFEFEPGLGK